MNGLLDWHSCYDASVVWPWQWRIFWCCGGLGVLRIKYLSYGNSCLVGLTGQRFESCGIGEFV